jgi:diphthamide biosynthesis protein 2
MTDTFSTPAEHIFQHPELETVQPIAGPSSNGDAAGETVEEAFEVADTIRRIVESGYKTVRRGAETGKRASRARSDEQIGLQFPDELLPSSVPVFRAIQSGIAHTGAQAYVLGDSTYGR